MEQHHRPRVHPGDELFKGLLWGGLFVLVPVHIGQAPEHGAVAQLLGHAQVGFAELPLGRAVELWHLLAGDLPVKGLVLLQLLAEALRIGDGGHIRVGIGVVAHGVALLHHAADKLRLGLQIVAHQKEGGRDVVLF